MVGVLLLKLAYYQAASVGVLIIVTWCSKSSLRGSYEPVALSLPLEIAKVSCTRAHAHARRYFQQSTASTQMVVRAEN